MYTPRRHRSGGLTDEGSYSKQRVAPKPSSRHAILSFHNERVPSRFVSASRRNFNTLVYLTNVRPLPLPLPIPLFLFLRIFASRILFFFFFFCFFYFVFFFLSRFYRLFVRRFFVLRPLCVPFSIEFLQVLPIYQEKNSFADRKIAFLYFPATKERDREDTPWL